MHFHRFGPNTETITRANNDLEQARPCPHGSIYVVVIIEEVDFNGCFYEGFLRECYRNVITLITDAKMMGMYEDVDGVDELSFEGLNDMDMTALEDLLI